jgi:hypothetical protein
LWTDGQTDGQTGIKPIVPSGYTGRGLKTKKHLCEQAQKDMYGFIRKIRQFKLRVDCQFDLFDKVVAPILLYGSEIWGFENLDIAERIHLKFLKHVFNLKSSTPAYMVYGETGRFPLYISIYCRMITYLAKLFSCQENKIVYVLYKHLHKLHCDGILSNPWLDCIQKILNMSGVSNIWQEELADQLVCFVCLNVCFESHEQFFSYLATVTITGDGAANLDLCLALMAFSSEGSFTCHTYCDTGPPFLWSYPKDP